jgi:hypothetical protein
MPVRRRDMIEAEWQACRNPAAMVAYMDSRASARKRRLFPCACVRRVWSQLTDPRSRRAVEVAERFADGLATGSELRAAHEEAESITDIGVVPATNEAAPAAARDVAAPEVAGALFSPFNRVPRLAADAARFEAMRRAVASGKMRLPPGSKEAEQAVQADLARCIFGNPFRPLIFSPAVLAFNDGAAVKLATVIYAEPDPASGELDTSRLAILADALEEVGVEDRGVLDHLRGKGPHARGCHVLDALLGRS